MASILDRYGIKEVADVTFYEITPDGTAGAPVLYLDTLKVSTLEQTAETSYAQGGKGNPRLIGWDFGKEMTLTLEDALFSPKSMAIMFGDKDYTKLDSTTIWKTMPFRVKVTENEGVKTVENIPTEWTDAMGNTHSIPTTKEIYDEIGTLVENDKDYVDGGHYFVKFAITCQGMTIDVGPNTFPDNYYITGDTYARNEVTGKDEYFQFIVPKGKITSENTITMEADGDPSVFSMTIDVLRAKVDGKDTMMQLVKYEVGEDNA